MKRPCGQLRQSQTVKPFRHGAGMHLRYAEAANSLLDEILAAPPYDTVLVEVGTFHDNPIKFLALVRRQQARPARRRERRQCPGAAYIIALDPVAQRLATHVGERRGLAP